MDCYILDENRRPVWVPDPTEAFLWMERHPELKFVCQTEISPDILVSTVFLGLDHNWRDTGLPVLFETMVFGDKTETVFGKHRARESLETYRYSSWDDAEAGHQIVVKKWRAVVGRARKLATKLPKLRAIPKDET